jgi:hypothetical protein
MGRGAPSTRPSLTLETSAAVDMSIVVYSDERSLRAVAGVAFRAFRAKLTFGGRPHSREDRARPRGRRADRRLRHVLGDLDTPRTVANAHEREELLRLLIKRIVLRGAAAEVTTELFAGVNSPGESSKSRQRGSGSRLIRKSAHL